MNKKQFDKAHREGFTLIEMLLVVAIIAILAGTVFAIASVARSRTRDGRIVMDLSQIRALAESSISGDYSDLSEIARAANGAMTNCVGATTEINKICVDINSLLPTVATSTSGLVIHKSATAYCVYTNLNSGGFFCADSTGFSKKVATDPGVTANANCNGTVYTCPAS